MCISRIAAFNAFFIKSSAFCFFAANDLNIKGRGCNPLAMSRNLQPRPFMFKALQAQKQKATNVVQKALRDALAQMHGATP